MVPVFQLHALKWGQYPLRKGYHWCLGKYTRYKTCRRLCYIVPEGAKRVIQASLTQAKAIKKAKKIAQNNQVEFLIHGRDNRISECNSHVNDPYPPRR